MRQTITLLFFLSFLQLSAQNWAPFKQTDTKRHFLSFHNVGAWNEDSQIRSLVVDTSYSNLSSTVLILKKGFSLIDSTGQQIIKGQVLGDTVRVYPDSSVITSLDRYGFRLTFPHKYTLNQTITLGKSPTKVLVATVDSMYVDFVKGMQDSLVWLNILTYDTLGNLDTSSGYSVVSKNNGLVEGLDFTILGERINVRQYFWNTATITNQQNNDLTVGDEYHYLKDSSLWLSGSREFHTMRVLTDVTMGSIRTLTYEHKWQRRLPALSNLKVDTITKSFVNTGTAFEFESQVIDDSLLFTNNQITFFNSKFSIYKPCRSICASAWLENNEVKGFSSTYNFFLPSPRIDSIINPSQLSGRYVTHQIGIGSTYYEWGIGGVGLDTREKNIVYIKQGNNIVGSPLNLITSVNEVEQNERYFIYPNPVKDQLNIDISEKVIQVEVFDLYGKQLLITNQTTQIDVSKLSRGIYSLKIQTRKGQKTKRFIKE